MKFNPILYITLVMLAGCNSLPPGEPPSGPITVPDKQAKQHSWNGAENYMLTSLSMHCLLHFPQGAKFSITTPKDNALLTARTYAVISSLQDSVPIQLTDRAGADYDLYSTSDATGTWILTLKNGKTGKIVWTEKLKIEGEQ